MEHEIVFLLGAEIDFLEFYRDHGDRFYDDVQEILSLLARNPWFGPKRFQQQRRLLIAGGPFALFYGIQGRRILITAIIDLRRDPQWIREKLHDRS